VRISSDPVTGATYRYRAIDAETFELCATFDRASSPRVGSGVDVWQHPAGSHCFTKITKRSAQ
jgi:hypothetical protein